MAEEVVQRTYKRADMWSEEEIGELVLESKIMSRLRELYPDIRITLLVRQERATLYTDDHPIVRYINVDLLEKQLKAGGDEAILEMVKHFAEYIEVRYLLRKKQYSRTKGHPPYNLTEAQIQYAIANTKSNSHAARFLGLCLNTYKKYAKIYGLYEGHKNIHGRGISKARVYPRLKLEEVFSNKHPNYDRSTLKYRLIHEKILPEECQICGEHTARIEDGQKPILLDFIDGDDKNMARENLRFICYNCAFRLRGKVHIRFSRRYQKEMFKELNRPIEKPKNDDSDQLFEQFNKK